MSFGNRYNSTGRSGGHWRGSQRSRFSASSGISSGGRRAQPLRQDDKSEPEYPAQPLGSLLASIKNADLTVFSEPGEQSPKITNCKYLASYNWLNTKAPTILVPGVPPAWTPLQEPRQLEQDRGNYFRDPNAAKYPTYPIEPAVRTVLAENPALPTTTVDLFACGSTVGNLLRFVRAVDKPFRFDVEVAGNTVFFIRKERSPTELIPGVYGYGHTFPESYTTWERDVKSSENSQRMITYDFGGLRCIIRFESDGYFTDMVSKVESDQSDSLVQKTKDETDLTSVLEGTKLSGLSQGTSSADSAIQIEPGHRQIPQKAIFDLKTRSARTEIDMTEMYPRLWVSQIPNFIVAYHTRGEFKDIRRQDIRADLLRWESENQDALRRLASLVRMIINYAKASSNAKLEIYRNDLDVLEIRKQAGDGRDALPPKVKSQWTQGEDASETRSTDWPEEEEDEPYIERVRGPSFSDSESEPDFTACSADHCGYCGHCTY